jgi:catechol 2,3-dioxygenase-like lactoylglutathione lyase family enzyme
MSGILQRAFGYQGNNMDLPVPDLEAAIPFYENVLGFQVVSRGREPHRSAILARDDVRIGLAENGRDPTQDGCAFHVRHIDQLFDEFGSRGLAKKRSDFSTEHRDGAAWRVFFVVAPDGLCYWFGERQPNDSKAG